MPYDLPALGEKEKSFSITSLEEITFQNTLLNTLGVRG